MFTAQPRMRISLPTIISFILSVLILSWGALVVVGYIDLQFIPEEYEFLNIPSLAIVFGGVLSSVFISTPFRDVLKSMRNSIRLFSQTDITEETLQEDIDRVLDWQRMISTDKLRSTVKLSNEYEGTFEGFYSPFLIPTTRRKHFAKLVKAISMKALRAKIESIASFRIWAASHRCLVCLVRFSG